MTLSVKLTITYKTIVQILLFIVYKLNKTVRYAQSFCT